MSSQDPNIDNTCIFLTTTSLARERYKSLSARTWDGVWKTFKITTPLALDLADGLCFIRPQYSNLKAIHEGTVYGFIRGIVVLRVVQERQSHRLCTAILVQIPHFHIPNTHITVRLLLDQRSIYIQAWSRVHVQRRIHWIRTLDVKYGCRTQIT